MAANIFASKAIAAGLLTLICTLTACNPVEKTRVRITATVAVGSTLYSGSAVQEFRCRKGGGMWASMDVGGCTVKGEAIYVDLKDRSNLVLPMLGKKGDATSYAKMILEQRDWTSDTGWWIEGDAVPMMVSFADPHDPRSVALVDRDNLPATFGEGVRVYRLTAEQTNDPVSQTLASRMPWVSEGKGRDYLTRQKSSGSYNVTPMGRLQRYDFKSGD